MDNDLITNARKRLCVLLDEKDFSNNIAARNGYLKGYEEALNFIAQQLPQYLEDTKASADDEERERKRKISKGSTLSSDFSINKSVPAAELALLHSALPINIAAAPRAISAPTPVVAGPPPKLPPFEGRTYYVGGPDYDVHCYQYAYSSLPAGTLQPRFILYPKGDADILLAIKYAKENNVRIAVRTGGHQYSGASSTNGENFLIDVSETYSDFGLDNNLVRTGISHSLQEFNTYMGSQGLFIPHGQCRHVHLGGHIQTGGYGQLGRAFGLLGDHVERMRVIVDDPDGEGGKVLEISKDTQVQQEKDIFWAFLGGSPGNFGIMTHVWLRPHKDSDYLESRGLKVLYAYSKERLQSILDFTVDMACDNLGPDVGSPTPRNFDLCVSVLSASAQYLRHIWPNVDSQMKDEHPEWGKDEQKAWPSVIVVYAQYVNLNNGVPWKPFFDKLKVAASKGRVGPLGRLFDYLLKPLLEPETPLPMSKLTTYWIFHNVREYLLPYDKRCYVTNWRDQLRPNQQSGNPGWSAWVSGRINEIESNLHKGCALAVQIQPFGGVNSMFYQNGKSNTTAYSWRDTTIVCVLDCFYGQQHWFQTQDPHDVAIQWQKRNDEEALKYFCDKDRRVLWASYGGHSLAATKDFYYELGKYEKLLKIKHEVDKRPIFSANSFCVGEPIPPYTPPSAANVALFSSAADASLHTAPNMLISAPNVPYLVPNSFVRGGVQAQPQIDEAAMVRNQLKQVQEYLSTQAKLGNNAAVKDSPAHIDNPIATIMSETNATIENLNKDVIDLQQQFDLA